MDNRGVVKSLVKRASRLVSVVVFLLLTGCAKDRFYDLARYVDMHCSKATTCTVSLSDVYPGGWTYAYFFNPGATSLGIENATGAKVNFDHSETCGYLIFVRGKKMVGHDMDCSASEEDNMDFYLAGERVYGQAIVFIDPGKKRFLKLPHDHCELTIQKDHVDADGRTIYMAKPEEPGLREQ